MLLFQSYCTSMYCYQLWFNSTKDIRKKLRINYNSALCRFLTISKPYSANQMFVSRGMLSFDELQINLFIGLLRELKTVQTQLSMPAHHHHHLFSYTIPFVNGGAHNCIYL